MAARASKPTALPTSCVVQWDNWLAARRSLMDWGLLFWTIALLGPLWWFVRQVHQRVHELAWLLTGHEGVALYLYQILLFPGVALHEFSHYLAASLLGVRVRNVSLRPNVQGQKVQMGAVEIDRPDFVRALLIGLAPLVVGSVVVVLIGQHIFDVGAVIEAARANDSRNMIEALRAAFRVPDAWIWFYLIFAVSNAMLPSESDREALRPMILFITVIVGGAALAGYGSTLVAGLAEPMETALGLLLVAFSITLFVDAIFVGVILLLREFVSMATGRGLKKKT